MEAGKKLVEFMIEPSNPLQTDFDNLENLLDRMTKTVNIKIIIDEMKP